MVASFKDSLQEFTNTPRILEAIRFGLHPATIPREIILTFDHNPDSILDVDIQLEANTVASPAAASLRQELLERTENSRIYGSTSRSLLALIDLQGLFIVAYNPVVKEIVDGKL